MASKFLPSPPRLRVRSLAALVRGIWGGHPYPRKGSLVANAIETEGLNPKGQSPVPAGHTPMSLVSKGNNTKTSVYTIDNHLAWLNVSLFLQTQGGRK